MGTSSAPVSARCRVRSEIFLLSVALIRHDHHPKLCSSARTPCAEALITAWRGRLRFKRMSAPFSCNSSAYSRSRFRPHPWRGLPVSLAAHEFLGVALVVARRADPQAGPFELAVIVEELEPTTVADVIPAHQAARVTVRLSICMLFTEGFPYRDGSRPDWRQGHAAKPDSPQAFACWPRQSP
jgi:hypothetical protein